MANKFLLNSQRGADHTPSDNLIIGLVTVASLYSKDNPPMSMRDTEVREIGAWMGSLSIEQMSELATISKCE